AQRVDLQPNGVDDQVMGVLAAQGLYCRQLQHVMNGGQVAKRIVAHVHSLVQTLAWSWGAGTLSATLVGARTRRSPSRHVRPMRSRCSHSGMAYLRVVPSRSRISATSKPGPPDSFSVISFRMPASTSACK